MKNEEMQECQKDWKMYNYNRMGGFSCGFIFLIILIGLILIGTSTFTVAGQNYNGFQLLANTLNVKQALANPPSWAGWAALGASKGTILQLQFGLAFCVIVVPLLLFFNMLSMLAIIRMIRMQKIMMWKDKKTEMNDNN